MLHPYMYTRNDPVNRIDPTGESWLGDGLSWLGDKAAAGARWVNNNIIKPTAKAVDEYLIQPVKNYVIDPAVKGFNDYVLEPLKSGYRQVKRGIAVKAEKARKKINRYISRGKAIGADLKEKAVRALNSKPGRMVMAGLQTAGGVAMTAAGGAVAATTGWTGAGAVLGGAMIAHGVNDIVSGGADLYFGATNQMNRMGSVNPLQEILYKPVFGEYADTAYMITSLGLGVGGGAASSMSKLAKAAQLSGRASNEAKIVSKMKYFLADETGSLKLGGWGRGSAVRGTKEAIKAGEHRVYTLRDPITDEIKYVGRTKNPVAREAAHKLAGDKSHLVFSSEHSGLTYQQARGLEQMLFENNGGFDKLLNKINPISPKNPNRSIYLDEANQFLNSR